MRFCIRCVTPDTRPRIEFDSDGVCNACRWADEKKKLDWKVKEAELRTIVESYRSKDGSNYDCICAVSGGKDSHYIVWYVTNVLKLRPLCVTFCPSIPSEVFWKNSRNMVEKLGVDHILVTPDPKVHARLCKIMLTEHGNVFLPWIQGIFASVTRIAVEKNIPLIFYGENGEREYGGVTSEENGQFTEESVRMRVQSSRPDWKEPEHWHEYGFEKREMLPYISPPKEDVERAGIRRLFLGDFVPWNNNMNLYYAMNIIGGFTVLDRRTSGTYTHGTSIDDYLDDLYLWFLWPKFGFCRATKSASPDIREGKLTRERAIELVRLYDGEFPSYCIQQVLEYLDMNGDEFRDIVRKFINKDIWKETFDGVYSNRNSIHGEERVIDVKSLHS